MNYKTKASAMFVVSLVVVFVMHSWFEQRAQNNYEDRCETLCYPKAVGKVHRYECRCDDGSNPNED